MLNMGSDDLSRKMNYLGINWGASFKMEREIQKRKTGPYNPLTTVVDNELEKQTSKDKLFDECGLCSITKKHKNPQLKCRTCDKFVCSICSFDPDPTSDNEVHRMHKTGDQQCTKEFIEQEFQFHCPKCDPTLSTSNVLKTHLEKEHQPFQQEFSGFSLVSDGSISNIYEKFTKCRRLFKKELDRMNHEERLHEYGESF